MSAFKRLRWWKTAPNDDTSIGGLLLRLGFITRPQLREAIEAKLSASTEQLLGEVLIARGAITRSQLERVIELQREERGAEHDYSTESNKLVAGMAAHTERLMVGLAGLEDSARRLTPKVSRLPEQGVPFTLTPHGAHRK